MIEGRRSGGKQLQEVKYSIYFITTLKRCSWESGHLALVGAFASLSSHSPHILKIGQRMVAVSYHMVLKNIRRPITSKVQE